MGAILALGVVLVLAASKAPARTPPKSITGTPGPSPLAASLATQRANKLDKALSVGTRPADPEKRASPKTTVPAGEGKTSPTQPYPSDYVPAPTDSAKAKALELALGCGAGAGLGAKIGLFGGPKGAAVGAAVGCVAGAIAAGVGDEEELSYTQIRWTGWEKFKVNDGDELYRRVVRVTDDRGNTQVQERIERESSWPPFINFEIARKVIG